LISPDTLSIPEIRRQKEVSVFEKIFTEHPILSLGIDEGRRTFTFVQEMNRTSSSHLFKTDGKGWPLIEGKNFHQYIPDYDKSSFRISPDDGLKWTSRMKEYRTLNKNFHNVSRLYFRKVAQSTDARSMIACILPKHNFVSDSATIVVPRFQDELVLNKEYYETISYLAAIFNSYTFDFMIRRRVKINLNFFYIEQSPIPSDINNWIAQDIIQLSARLSAPDERFKDLSEAINVQYGSLTIKERIDIMAKIDALVAHQYGLSRNHYEYIISTFDGFEIDEKIYDMDEILWNESLVRKFHGQVRKKALNFYDVIASGKWCKSE
jgi:hypothetical protein